jgi:hypothetical protein
MRGCNRESSLIYPSQTREDALQRQDSSGKHLSCATDAAQTCQGVSRPNSVLHRIVLRHRRPSNALLQQGGTPRRAMGREG